MSLNLTANPSFYFMHASKYYSDDKKRNAYLIRILDSEKVYTPNKFYLNKPPHKIMDSFRNLPKYSIRFSSKVNLLNAPLQGGAAFWFSSKK